MTTAKTKKMMTRTKTMVWIEGGYLMCSILYIKYGRRKKQRARRTSPGLPRATHEECVAFLW